MYVKIPIQIAYFILGCVSTISILLIYCYISIKKQKKRRDDILNSITNALKSQSNDKDK